MHRLGQLLKGVRVAGGRDQLEPFLGFLPTRGGHGTAGEGQATAG